MPSIKAMPTFVEQRLVHNPDTNKCEVKDFFVYHSRTIMETYWNASYNGLEGYRVLTDKEQEFFSK